MAPGAVDRIAPRSTISQRPPVFADPRPGGGPLQHAMPRVTGCESTPDDSVLGTPAAAPEAARRAGARLVPVIALPGLAATAEPAARRGRQAAVDSR